MIISKTYVLETQNGKNVVRVTSYSDESYIELNNQLWIDKDMLRDLVYVLNDIIEDMS